jgi:hypothetical protein
MRDGKERDMLNIGVMFGLIGYDVVYVVASLPPPKTQATDEVCDNDSYNTVHVEIVRDSHVASIMGSENKLMPNAA